VTLQQRVGPNAPRLPTETPKSQVAGRLKNPAQGLSYDTTGSIGKAADLVTHHGSLQFLQAPFGSGCARLVFITSLALA
jgi:hypothetical protein